MASHFSLIMDLPNTVVILAQQNLRLVPLPLVPEIFLYPGSHRPY
jgi:hypothetical protein